MICVHMHFTVARLPVQAVARPMSRHEPGTRMSVLMANPDYLLEGFAEKKCQVRCRFQPGIVKIQKWMKIVSKKPSTFG